MSFENYNYSPKTPQEVDRLAIDIDQCKVHGTWLMAPGQDPSDCFLLLAMLSQQAVERIQRLQLIHVYEYMDKSNGANKFKQPTFMSCSFLDKADMVRVEKRLNQIRQAIRRNPS